jgi:hypothetical protein
MQVATSDSVLTIKEISSTINLMSNLVDHRRRGRENRRGDAGNRAQCATGGRASVRVAENITDADAATQKPERHRRRYCPPHSRSRRKAAICKWKCATSLDDPRRLNRSAQRTIFRAGDVKASPAFS